MIASTPDIHERSLFQLGDWHLVKPIFPEGMQGDMCYATHTNCAPTKWDARVRMMDSQCFRCGESVPDELQALVILHRWGEQ